MSCPTCGLEYVEIGDNAICPKCGRSRGYKQIDWVEILTQNENMKRQQEYFINETYLMEKEIVRLKKIITQMNKEAMGNAPHAAQD